MTLCAWRRSATLVRTAISKSNAKLAEPGSVAFQFKHCGQVFVAPTVEEDQVSACTAALMRLGQPPAARMHASALMACSSCLLPRTGLSSTNHSLDRDLRLCGIVPVQA